jgi:branched-subunit amino acid transport protein AzlD
MNTSVLLAITALLATSCLVRILPVFVTLNLTDASRRLLERVLPTAVFINFAVYILYSEAAKAPLAATLAMALVAGIAVATRLGLIVTAALGSACYYLLQAGIAG